jgi:hypothetical protein
MSSRAHLFVRLLAVATLVALAWWPRSDRAKRAEARPAPAALAAIDGLHASP